MKKLITYVTLVCFAMIAVLSTGCASWNKGGSSKKAWTAIDNSINEYHSSWEFSDPLTATKKFFGCLIEVNGSINHYSLPPNQYLPGGQVVGQNGYSPGKHFDYTFSRWCRDRNYLVEFDGDIWEVPIGKHPALQNGAVVYLPDK